MIFNCLDYLLTRIGLNLGAVEINPYFNTSILYMIFKLLSIGYLLVLLGYCYKLNEPYIKSKLVVTLILIVLLLIFLTVVINNLWVIITLL
jgi:hypothetical protein